MGAVLHWPAYERPRERLLTEGAQRLSDTELLALVVGSSARGSGGVLHTCRRLLDRFGGLHGMSHCGVGELMAESGIGRARACALVAMFELGRRQVGRPALRGDPLTRSEQVYQRLRGRIGSLSQEVFIVLALDARNRLLSLWQVSQGTGVSVEVHPREVFAPLLREAATAAIVAHNHPSGDPSPSDDDREITARLAHAGKLLGIPLLDHIIVGGDGYVSLAERGLI